MKKYLEILIPVGLLIILFIIGGFSGVFNFIFSGCVIGGFKGCMGPVGVSILGVIVNRNALWSLLLSLFLSALILIPKLILNMIKKEKIDIKTNLYVLLWTSFVIWLVVLIFLIQMSKHVLY